MQRQFVFLIVDVFSRTAFGGNQLAVLPDAKGLSDQEMQDIAREFNFSETAFVLPVEPNKGRYRLRIFTPNTELAFAGHPTIGSACAFVMAGYAGPGNRKTLIFEEGIGPVDVLVDLQDGVFQGTMSLLGRIEQPQECVPPELVAAALSLSVPEVAQTFFASMGLPFCFAHLTSRAAVDRAKLDKIQWHRHFSTAWSSNIYLFSGDLTDNGNLYARMFAPALGIDEDPATGSACAALVGAAAAKSSDLDGSFHLSIEQGVSMGRSSRIEAAAFKSGGNVSSVSVGGATAFVAKGEITIPGRVGGG
jgi:trans-2,3-dihydro-3-hydroxyanthranilate isomerase